MTWKHFTVAPLFHMVSAFTFTCVPVTVYFSAFDEGLLAGDMAVHDSDASCFSAHILTKDAFSIHHAPL